MAVGVHRTGAHTLMNLGGQRSQGFPVAGHCDHRGPFTHHGYWRRAELAELGSAVDDFAVDNRQHRLDPFDRLVFDVEIVGLKGDMVCQLPPPHLAFLALFR